MKGGRGGRRPGFEILCMVALALGVITLNGLFAGPAVLAYSSNIKHRTLKSPSPQDEGEFGNSVATSGGLAIVGAPLESSGGEESAGNAYAFDVSTGALVGSFTSPNPQFQGGFGWSVAIQGSLVVIGALGETSNGHSDAGNVYAFNSTTGNLIETLTSPNAQVDGYFGASVAIGSGLVAVGAYGETANGLEGAGNVYVFSSTTWALTNTLTSGDAQNGGEFGYSIAASEGLLVAGAPEEGIHGNAYVYNDLSGELVASIANPDAKDSSGFGWSVAIDGRLVAVGAPSQGVGSAFTFSAQTGSLVAKLSSPSHQDASYFGWAVSVSGPNVLVGAPSETTGEPGYGVAYLFNAKTGSLKSTVSNPDKSYDGSFGISVVLSGKFELVGAYTQIVHRYHKAGEAFIL